MTARLRARMIGALLAGVAAWAPAAFADDADALQPGDVLDQRSWQKAEHLLPSAVLDHYKRGEYANPIVDWPYGLQRWGEDFQRGTHENNGKFGVSEQGTIIDTATGRQPAYIIGFPFPEIDPADPQGGIKVIWNYYYQYWYSGNSHNLTVLEWLSPTGLERRAVEEVRFLYYDGQPRHLAPAANPNNLQEQFLSLAVQPADLQGTRALSWRFRDAGRRDLVWAYVPALRRVRQVSPANRSDGFLGSDMSQDDGPFFNGKPQDFIWKLVGDKDALRFADPFSLKRDAQVTRLPGGGWKIHRKDVPFAGYRDPGWKGSPYAPVQLVLAKRRQWVIEAVPKDKYYLFGKLLMYIDKETNDGTWNLKYSWDGELVGIVFNARSLNFSPDGTTYFRVNPVSVMHAENVKLRRATVAAPPPEGMKDAPYDVRIPLDPALFNYENLGRMGK